MQQLLNLRMEEVGNPEFYYMNVRKAAVPLDSPSFIAVEVAKESQSCRIR